MTAPQTVAPQTAPGVKPELTHPCARCGAPVPIDAGLCERCNPLGLRDVSSSQVHGIAIAGVFLFVVFLAVAAKFALAGIGPFEAAIAPPVADTGGLTLTLTVTNKGSSTGQSTCQVTDPADRTVVLLDRAEVPGRHALADRAGEVRRAAGADGR